MSRVQNYIIKTSYCKYYARVEIMSRLLHKVYVGGRKKCVAFSIYLNGDSHPNLDTWSYNEQCNVEGNLENGRGSVHLIKTACSFVKSIYNHSMFEFIDKSYVTCTNNWRMPLCSYYLVKHGKTWYEKNLGAVPESIKARTRYAEEKQKLLDCLNSKTKSTFEEFANVYDINKKLHPALGSIYENSPTLKHFFHSLFDQFDCGILKGWFTDFVNDYIHVYGTSWTFDSSSFACDISYEKITGNPPKDMFIVVKTPHNTTYGT
jgi:hypothetical protein